MNATDPTKKANIALSIESVLLKLGEPEYELVESKLKKEHSCFFVDCYDNPQALARVLKDVYGNACKDILESIKNEFGVLSSEKPYSEFLQVLQKS